MTDEQRVELRRMAVSSSLPYRQVIQARALLEVAKGRGRKPWLPAGTTERVVELTRTGTPPGGATQWTTRSLAGVVGVSDDTVRRIWDAHGLKPWRVDTFKISNDPDFEAKLIDVVGLY